jgi:hypothetical protein
MGVGAAFLGAAAAITLASVAAGCGGSDAEAVETANVDATAPKNDAAESDTPGSSDGAPSVAMVDAAAPEASCGPELALLDAALGMGVCSQCIGSKCPFFVNECVPDCRCVESTVTLLTCLEVATTHSACLTNVTSLFTPTELMELGECEATCAAACHPGNETTTPDAGAPDAGADSGQTGTGDAGGRDGAITDASDSG